MVWKSVIHLNPARPRCYKTGSTVIKAICHHCGRPISEGPGTLSVLRNFFASNREFDGLGLAQAAHCHEDAHSSPRFMNLLLPPGLLLILISLLVLSAAGVQEVQCLQNLVDVPVVPGSAASEVLRDPALEGINPAACYPPQHLGLLVRLGASLLGLMIGLAISLESIRLDRRSVKQQTGWQPAFPAQVKAEYAEVIEEIEGEIDLGKPPSRSQIGIKGRLQVGLTFHDDNRARLSVFQNRYKIPSIRDAEIHAGSILLLDAPHIVFDMPPDPKEPLSPTVREWAPYPNIIDLRAYVGEHPALIDDRQSDLSWTVQLPYHGWLGSYEGQEEIEFPIKMSSSLEAEGSQIRLGIEVQIPNLPLEPQSVVVIDSLKLHTPFDPLGAVKYANPPADETSPGDWQEILWENRHFTEEEIAARLKQLYVYFPDTHPHVDTTIHGELVLLVSPTLSKIRRLRLFNALGLPVKSEFAHWSEGTFSQFRRRVTRTWRTLLGSLDWILLRVRQPVSGIASASNTPSNGASAHNSEVYLKLSHEGLRRDPLADLVNNLMARRPNLRQSFTHREGSDVALYAVTRIRVKFRLPLCDVVRNRKEIQRIEFPLGNVIPNHTLIGEIVDHIANYRDQPAYEYHIREVIENSPRVSRLHSSIDKRLWNISGRRYFQRKPYPIDFHIVISGSDYQGYADRSEAAVILDVQSTVNSEDMRRHVEETRDHLREMIEKAAKARSTESPTAP